MALGDWQILLQPIMLVNNESGDSSAQRKKWIILKEYVEEILEEEEAEADSYAQKGINAVQ